MHFNVEMEHILTNRYKNIMLGNFTYISATYSIDWLFNGNQDKCTQVKSTIFPLNVVK